MSELPKKRRYPKKLIDCSGVLGTEALKGGQAPPDVSEVYKLEKASGEGIVDAARQTLPSLELFIFSTLSASKRLSDGRYKHMYHFDAKAEAIEYLEATYPELVERTVGLQLGMFVTNTLAPTPLQPTKVC